MRTAGSKNKPKEITDHVITGLSNEDIFLSELVRGKAYWHKVARQLQKDEKNFERELEYAGAYRILINKFTQPEIE